MSASVSGLVWEVGPDNRNLRFVLLAIADNASDEGYAWPSIKTLAAKCLFTPRYVMGTIQTLEAEEWLRVDRRARDGKGSEYYINVEKLEVLKSEKRSREKGSREKQNKVQVKSNAVSGENGDIAIRMNRQEPSLEPFELVPSSTSKTPTKNENKPSVDERFKTFLEDFNSYWNYMNVEMRIKTEQSIVPFSFGSPDGKSLKTFLKDNPKIERKLWKDILENRTLSEDVTHTEPLHRWIGKALNFASGPLNKYGKPIECPA